MLDLVLTDGLLMTGGFQLNVNFFSWSAESINCMFMCVGTTFNKLLYTEDFRPYCPETALYVTLLLTLFLEWRHITMKQQHEMKAKSDNRRSRFSLKTCLLYKKFPLQPSEKAFLQYFGFLFKILRSLYFLTLCGNTFETEHRYKILCIHF